MVCPLDAVLPLVRAQIIADEHLACHYGHSLAGALDHIWTALDMGVNKDDKELLPELNASTVWVSARDGRLIVSVITQMLIPHTTTSVRVWLRATGNTPAECRVLQALPARIPSPGGVLEALGTNKGGCGLSED